MAEVFKLFFFLYPTGETNSPGLHCSLLFSVPACALNCGFLMATLQRPSQPFTYCVLFCWQLLSLGRHT